MNHSKVSTVASPSLATTPLPVNANAITRERDGQWLLIAGGVLLGTIGVFVEEAGQHPLVTVWFRCAFGALALLAWCLATGRGQQLFLHGRARWVACATGVLMVLNLALWQCLVGAVALVWAPFVLGWPQQGAAWGWLLGLGVLHTGLAYVVLFAGMSRLGLGRIAVLQFVYPLTAVLVDWVVYGRTRSHIQLGGVGLMAVALWTIRRPRSKGVGTPGSTTASR